MLNLPATPGGRTDSATDTVSIVVVCCGNWKYTEQCLEAVLKHTAPAHELVLVNNGSSDDTGLYLDALAGRMGSRRVAVLNIADNCGFPAACNRALKQAKGEFVVFLHNDTVVSAGWL